MDENKIQLRDLKFIFNMTVQEKDFKSRSLSKSNQGKAVFEAVDKKVILIECDITNSGMIHIYVCMCVIFVFAQKSQFPFRIT